MLDATAEVDVVGSVLAVVTTTVGSGSGAAGLTDVPLVVEQAARARRDASDHRQFVAMSQRYGGAVGGTVGHPPRPAQ
jgi:hypothetical protein